VQTSQPIGQSSTVGHSDTQTPTWLTLDYDSRTFIFVIENFVFLPRIQVI
jgi:hypothetical protein